MDIPQEFGQLDGVLQGASRVARHQVGHQKLLLARLFIGLFKLIPEFQECFPAAFAHSVGHVFRNMLRCDLELAAHVMSHQLGNKSIAAAVCQKVVVADARADEDLFYGRQRPDALEDLQIGCMARFQFRAGCRPKTATVFAGSSLFLQGTGLRMEIRGRPAHVVDIAFEILQFCQKPGLAHDRSAASRLDYASLVGCEGAEGATAEAPSVCRDAEFYLFKRRYASFGFVGRMPIPGKGELVDGIQFLRFHGQRRRVLDHPARSYLLCHRSPPTGVLFPFGQGESLRESSLVRGRFLEGGEFHHKRKGRKVTSHVAGAPHIGDVSDIFAGLQSFGDLQYGRFSHAPYQKVRPGVGKDGATNVVGPIVIMGKPAEACLDPPYD